MISVTPRLTKKVPEKGANPIKNPTIITPNPAKTQYQKISHHLPVTSFFEAENASNIGTHFKTI